MNILLIRPRPHKETLGLQHVMICEPLEFEYVSALLEQNGHKVTIVDMILEKKPVKYFIEKYKPKLVGMTAYISHVRVVKDYAKQIKSVDKSILTAVGGVHAEVVPEDFSDENIDFIIRANGLNTILEIANNMSEQKSRKTAEECCAALGGVWQQGKAPCQKESSFNYPMPDRSKVSSYRSKYYYMFHNPCALMKTSYGCPYQCKFCFCRQITDGKYFARSVSSIIEELKAIPEREVYIVDDDFLFNRERLLEFCRELKANKLRKKFLVYGRADFIAANEDVIKEFASCGLRAVIVGLESCSEKELKKYNKKSSVEVNENAVAILKRYEVECYATLILGIDWCSEDFNSLYRWIKKLDVMFINLQPFTPMPGTELYDEYKDQLIIPREEYESWDLAHLTVRPSAMSVSSYYWNMIKIYYKVTMAPRNIWRMIKRYGIKENIKLSFGASHITFQYFIKMIKGK